MDLYNVISYTIAVSLCITGSIAIFRKLTSDVGAQLEIDWLRYLILNFLGYCISDLLWMLSLVFHFDTQIYGNIISVISSITLLNTEFCWYMYASLRLRYKFVEKTHKIFELQLLH